MERMAVGQPRNNEIKGLIVEMYSCRLAREADLDLADPLLLLGEEELGQEGVGGVALCEAGAG